MNTEGKEPAIGQLCDSQKHPEQAKPQGRPARVHGFLRRDGKAKELVSRDLNTTVEAWGALEFVCFSVFFTVVWAPSASGRDWPLVVFLSLSGTLRQHIQRLLCIHVMYGHNHTHCLDEETEVQGSQKTYPRPED